MNAVVQSIHALGRLCKRTSSYHGPQLETDIKSGIVNPTK